MSESKVATTVSLEVADSMGAAAATTAAGASPFEPSLWDDFFITYATPSSQA